MSSDFFDWEFYINKYSDLKENGVNTKELAYHHWITHGKIERRICNSINFNWRSYILNH